MSVRLSLSECRGVARFCVCMPCVCSLQRVSATSFRFASEKMLRTQGVKLQDTRPVTLSLITLSNQRTRVGDTPRMAHFTYTSLSLNLSDELQGAFRGGHRSPSLWLGLGLGLG